MQRILLIEDSPTQRERLRLVLEAAGYAVEVAADGEAGLRLASPELDLVVSDVMMPGLSGYDVCRALRARAELCRLPVILLTTLEAPDEIIEALACGADGFVTKSENTSVLEARVRGLLASRTARADAGDAIPVYFLDRRIEVTADRARILDLLISVFEGALRANTELRQAAEALTAKNEALIRAEGLRQELSELLVHDLKSPSAGLMMLARGVLRRKDLTPAQREQWSTVFLTAETCQRFVMNLLDISRSEDGALALHLQPVPLVPALEEVAALLTPLREERRQTVEIDHARAPETVVADPELLRRVLLNLLDNALRHTPAGGQVWIEARQDGEDLRISVINEGTPIPESLREHIFGKYVRLAAEEEASRSGRGLGLAFCRIAAEAHGGEIGVDSDAAGHTRFWVRLPLAGGALPTPH